MCYQTVSTTSENSKMTKWMEKAASAEPTGRSSRVPGAQTCNNDNAQSHNIRKFKSRIAKNALVQVCLFSASFALPTPATQRSAVHEIPAAGASHCPYLTVLLVSLCGFGQSHPVDPKWNFLGASESCDFKFVARALTGKVQLDEGN